MILSAVFQLRVVIKFSLMEELKASWRAGLLSDMIFQCLLKEKTFEAPLSLFLQCLAAPFTVDSTRSAMVFLISIPLSIHGVTQGLYMSLHLCLDDASEDDDVALLEEIAVLGKTTGQAAGQPGRQAAPSLPPGLRPDIRPPGGGLPTPPGLGPDIQAPTGVLPAPPGMEPPGFQARLNGVGLAPVQLDARNVKDTE
eukprot:Skav225923  [mRNA]  locus=scaffold1500:277181:277771:- [translate_table: standard]